MAYFEIYAAKGLRRKWQLYAGVPRAMSGVWLFWKYIEDKYLPKIYSSIRSDVPLSRLFVDGGAKAKEIWNLWMDKRMTSAERLVLFTTFDKKYLPFEHIPEVAKAYREVHTEMGNGSILSLIADKLEHLYNNHKDIKYLGFNATSVSWYEDIIGSCMDRKGLDNMWEDYLEAEKQIKQGDSKQ